MNCRHCNKYMYSYFEGELSAQIRQEIDLHLSQCPACRFQYDLTEQENMVLQDCSDIPALSPDFNQQVWQAINVTAASMAEVLPSPGNSPKRRFWVPAFSGAMVAVVLLALCIYVPGIIPGKPARISDVHPASAVHKSKSVAKTEAGNAAADYRINEKNWGNVEEQSSSAQLKLPSESLTYGDTVLNNDAASAHRSTQEVNRSNRNSESGGSAGSSGSFKGSAVTGASPEPQGLIKSMAPASIAAVPAAPPSAEIWSVQNIPPQYKLLNTSNVSPGQAEYSYQSADGTKNVNVDITVVSPNQSDAVVMGSRNEPTSTETGLMASRPHVPTCISRVVEVDKEKLKVTVTSNLSAEELTQLVDKLVINKKP